MTWVYHEDDRPDVQALVPASASRVLDVGCAAGALGEALRRRGAYVHGIEMNPSVASRAASRLDAVTVGDVSAVDLPAEGFDCIIFADILEHVPDPSAVVRRFLPLLRPSGQVVISVPNFRFYLVLLRLIFDRWSYTDSGIRDRGHVRVFTRGSLFALLDEVELETVSLHRNYRLFEDQRSIGRVGAVVTRVVRLAIAPIFFRNLLAFQYLVVAKRR